MTNVASLAAKRLERQTASASSRSWPETSRRLLDHAREFVALIGPETSMVEISPAVESILGWTPQELIGRPVLEFAHPEDLSKIHEALDFVRQMPSGTPSDLRVRMRRKEGGYRLLETTGVRLDPDSDFGGIVFTGRTSTEELEDERRLARQSHRDPLTGLANRILLVERLAAARERAVASRRPYAVVNADLDRFKVVNDTLGHAGGDALLVKVAGILRQQVHEPATVARLGGDEFAILLEDLESVADAEGTVGRILGALKEPIVVDGNPVHVRASLGIALSEPPFTEAREDLLRFADLAMHRAKDQPARDCEVYDPAVDADEGRALFVENELRQALAEEQLRLHYQPIVELRNGRCTGVEALLRWEHPRRGLLGPNEFIPLAEQSGLILPIGRWAVEAACRQLAEWERHDPQEAPCQVSVNVSGRQLEDPHLTAWIRHCLDEHQLSPERLQLEMTETAFLRGRAVLEELGELGVRLALDDFGTGYSSLTHLTELPIHVLKIDRSFVAGTEASDRARRVASAVVRLGQELGLKVIAEGVETEEQVAWLCESGCEHAQGFLLAHPAAPETSPPGRIAPPCGATGPYVLLDEGA